METETIPSAQENTSRRLAWLPIPLLLALVVALWVANPQTIYESQLLLLLLNFLFSGVVTLFIGFLAGRSFLVLGKPGILMLGGGVLLWGASAMVASTLFFLDGNLLVTVHNLGTCGAAACHLAGLVWRGQVQRPTRWLAAVYASVFVVIALLAWGATAEWLPLFFIQGQGGTLVRQVVLGTTIGMFALAGGLMLSVNQWRPPVFLYWYGLGLALLAVGLTGVMLQSELGGPLGWAGRCTQYLGGGYLFVAAKTAVREAGGWGVSLEMVEEAWRLEFLPAIRSRTPLLHALRYSSAFLGIGMAHGVRSMVTAAYGAGLPTFITFYPAVLLLALLAGFGPGLMATLLTVLCVAVEKLSSGGDFQVGPIPPVDRLALALFTAMSVLVCGVAELYRRDRRKAAAYDRETAVRESQARLAVFAQATFEGIVESERGRIVDCNEQMARMLGYSVHELKEMEFATLIDPEDRERSMLTSGEAPVSTSEVTMIRKDGSRIIVEIHGRSMSPGSVRRHLAIHDITQRKQSEAALIQSREDLDRAQEVGQIGSWRLDTRRNVLSWSEENHRIFGVPKGTPMSYESFLEIVHPDDREYVDTRWSAGLRGEPYDVEHRLVVGGQVKWVREKAFLELDEAGNLLGGFGITQDITERKRAEGELQASESRFRLLSRTAARLLEAESPLRVVSELAAEVMEYLDCQAFFNFVVDEQAGKLRLNAYAGIPDDEAERIEWLDYGVAVCGCVARDRDRIIAEDICSVSDPRTELVAFYGIKAYACHPLIAGGRVIGTLSFGTRTRSRFSSQELDLMKTVADQVAVSMERVRLMGELARSRDELEVRVKSRTADLAKMNEELRELTKVLRDSEEMLRRNIDLLQKVFDGITDPLIMLDGAGLVTMVNKAAMDYYGLGEGADICGKPCFQGLRGREGPCPECNYPFLSAGPRTTSFERNSLRDSARAELVTVYPVQGEHGGREAAIIRVSDITQAKILERQIIQNEKLAALGLVTSGIAHEINNPNTFIHFNLPILRRYLEELMPILDEHAAHHPEFEVLHMSYGELKEDIFKLIGNMEHGSQRINNIVGTLRSFVKKRSTGELQMCNLKPLIEKVVTFCHTEIRRTVKSFEIQIPEDIPSIYSDPEALEQVILNLLINAVHVCDKDNSHISLKVGLGTARSGINIEVSDNGSGIEEPLLSKVFDPFFTTKPASLGTGLGLYICHHHVESLGGTIEVESRVGEGSTFRVWLPQLERT